MDITKMIEQISKLAARGGVRYTTALRVLDAVAHGRGLPPMARFELANVEAIMPKSELPHGEKFRAAWQDWQAYRRERGKKITAMTAVRQLTILAGLSEHDAVATIEKSIRNGWAGLFPQKGTNENDRRNDGTSNREFAESGKRATTL